MRDLPSAHDVVRFWRDAGPKRWFAKSSAFDADFRSRFEALHQAAAARALDGWAADAEGALALLVLLDQFPRNAYRGTAHMFATDGLARAIARAAIASGLDRQVEAGLRCFFYLPFMHSEDLADQERSVQLNAALDANTQRFAQMHHELIARFSRFPHRNAVMGRETTAEEQRFLDEGGFSG